MATRILILSVFLAGTPAHASGGIQIPEPSNLALFGLGLLGLIIGRHTARNKRRNDDQPDS